ncbi:MAG: hypothetical protein Q7T74_07000 [Candidatus Saccharibacteria bacterium]|nr:hypothetical protein [Candidatus Saccharibacteria bacterium]
MKNVLIASACIILISGCANTEVKERVEKLNNTSTVEFRKAETIISNRPIILPSLKFPYLGSRSVIEADFAEDLPSILRSSKKAQFNSKPMTADEFSRLLSEETGLPVKLFSDSTNNQLVTAGGKQTFKTVDFSALPPMTWKQTLDTGIALFGLDWDFYDGALHIESTFRKNYAFPITPSTTKTSSKVGKSSSVSQGASGSSNNAVAGNFNGILESGFESDIDPVKDITESLVAMAGDAKRVTMNRSMGLATVNCSKDCHKQIKSFVKTATAMMTSQVTFRVKVITIDTSNTGESGVDWSLVYKRAVTGGRGIGLGLVSPTNLAQTIAGALTTNIFNPPNSVAGNFDGSSAIIKALSELYTNVDVKPYDLMGLSNQPAVIQSNDQQSFISGTTVVPTGITGTPVYSQTIGYATFGQIVQMIPTVLSDGKIIVQYGIDDTKLKSLTPGQQGEVDKLRMGGLKATSRVILRSGSTWVLNQFKNTSSTNQDRGLLEKQQIGSKTSKTSTLETIILITPYVSGV